MGKEYPKWLVGCGVGCLAVVVLVLVLGVGAFIAARRMAGGFSEAGKAVSRVEEEYGSPEAYTPEPDGRIPAERVRAFLAVRSRTVSARSRLGTSVEELESLTDSTQPGRRQGFREVIKIIRTGAGAIPKMAEFQRHRADALIEHRMGLGEYQYIYSLAYYSFLKKDPGDGPKRIHTGSDNNVTLNDHTSPEEIRDSRHTQMSRRVRRLFVRFLENAASQAKQAKSAEKSSWIQAVDKELSALDLHRDRIPWEEGLPPEIDESLRPFREELDRSYDPLMNPVEFIEWDQQHRR